MQHRIYSWGAFSLLKATTRSFSTTIGLAFVVSCLMPVMATASPAELPGNFNPETSMLIHKTKLGTFHESRAAAGLIAQLIRSGTAEDFALADKVTDALIDCQELRENDPHYGNYRWMREDSEVSDLNAVEFILDDLIPVMLDHGDQVPEPLRAKLLETIRLGLDEVRHIDVSLAYTNISVFDFVNSSLGGQLLGDESLTQRGQAKLQAWAMFTLQNGTTFEYNSPTYTPIIVRALAALAERSDHESTRVTARMMATRLGLGVALHIHPTTGRMVGPHSRAYHPSVIGEADAEISMVQNWIKQGDLPDWVNQALSPAQMPYQIRETALERLEMDLTTYHTEAFALGTASRVTTDQSDVLMVHYNRPGTKRPGVMYSRYLLGDKWLGDFYHPTDRAMDRNLSESGKFWGVQSGARSIGLYTNSTFRHTQSAKAALIWTAFDEIEEIWVGDTPIKELPYNVAVGEVIVVASGDVYIAVRPLTLTDLGRDAPIRLTNRGGDLVLELHNYLGKKRLFWDMQWPGGFFKGLPQNGVYLEVAARTEYPSAQAFGEIVASGTLTDEAAPPFVYYGAKPRPWKVEYTRDGETLGLEVDLMEWDLIRRWTQDGDLGWVQLDSEVARQNADGKVVVGGASLTSAKSPAWLYAAPDAKIWSAGYLGAPTPITLKVPGGSVHIESMGTGTITWNNGEVTVEGLNLVGSPIITRDPLTKNGSDNLSFRDLGN